jgi:pimeloyl-ACP methyl ester carboxylesterase
MTSSRNLRWLAAALLIAGALVHYFVREHAPARKSQAHAGHAAPAPRRMLGTLAFTPCTLAPQFGAASVEAQCTTLPVPENPALPQGRQVRLHIAWIPAAENGTLAPDPVFLLAGGPGQSAAESYPQVAPAFREVLKHRNVFLLDQRGTGKSHPLKCDLDEDVAADSPQAIAATERCRDQLSKTADLRFYTTTDAVRDLEAVRVALGVPQLDLVGISYGTRVAQQYAMRHPASTRALVLDSVAPNRLILGNDFAANLERALDLQFAQCEDKPACVAAVGHPRAQLDALMATLRADPPRVRYRDAATGAAMEDVLQPEAVAGLMRMYAYMPLMSSLLPLQLGEAAHGRYDGLMALAKMLGESIGGQMAMGMQLSVICSEDAAGFKPDPGAAGTLLGNQFSEFLGAQCAVWPKGAMPADFHQPLASDVPALVLEGEFDPVTPPRYGEEVLKTLPNGRLFVLRGQGHNVIGAGCMPKLFAQFLQTADAKALDGKCLDDLAYVPPFISFNGWQP